ncbi:ribonuclease H-like domain-containing protein [Entophlyctis helioformis]|nr:ribonuclease H-like domain-containing protein [Entophlyctis helioformis]
MSESDLRNHQFPLSPFEDDAASATSKDASVSAPSGPRHPDVQSPAPTAASARDQAAQREGKTRTVCERCGCQYVPKYPLDEVDMEACHFHTGRILRERVDGQFQRRYTCCQEIVESSRRCAKGPHVFKEESNSLLHARIPFTKLAKDVANAQPVVALDCEMSYTTAGMEVTRVTITDWNGNSLLDELCRPDNPVLDLNTAWSGITSLESARYNLAGIRAQMDKFMSQDTIIIGHGLENDMRTLRIEHRRIIDTVHVFPHPNGLPYRFSLKRLAEKVLGVFVQTGTDGHDSLEDARTCIHLVQRKMDKGDTIVILA